MDSVLYSMDKDKKVEEEKIRKKHLRIGNIVDVFIPYWHYVEFINGFKGGMTQICNGHYVFPLTINNWIDRGFRFAWLCHFYSRKHSFDEFPEIGVIYARHRK